MAASGLSPAEAARAACTKFAVGKRQGERYVERAFANWAAKDQQHRHTRKMTLRRRMEAFYVEAKAAGHYGPALQVLDRLARLDGLYAPESVRVQHEGDPGFKALSMTTDAMRRRVEELLEMREALLTQPDVVTKKSDDSALN